MLVFLASIFLLIVLWPIIKWAIIILIGLVVAAYFYFRYRFKKALKEGVKYNQVHFDEPFNKEENNKDVVDVTFREKEKVDD